MIVNEAGAGEDLGSCGPDETLPIQDVQQDYIMPQENHNMMMQEEADNFQLNDIPMEYGDDAENDLTDEEFSLLGRSSIIIGSVIYHFSEFV